MTEVKGTGKNGDSLTGVVVPIGEEVRPPELEVRNGSPWDAQTKQLRYHRMFARHRIWFRSLSLYAFRMLNNIPRKWPRLTPT